MPPYPKGPHYNAHTGSMRNYIKMWYQSFDIYSDDNPPDPPTLIGVLNHFEGTEEEAADFAGELSSLFVPQTAPEPLYVLLNKEILITIFNDGNRIPVGALTDNESPRTGVNFDYRDAQSPEDEWPSNDGNKFGPTFNDELAAKKREILRRIKAYLRAILADPNDVDADTIDKLVDAINALV